MIELDFTAERQCLNSKNWSLPLLVMDDEGRLDLPCSINSSSEH